MGCVVKQSDRIRWMFITVMAVFLITGIAEGQTTGMVFEWEPHQTMTDLGLHAVFGIPERNGLVLPDEFQGTEGEKIRASDVKNERNLDIYRHRNIRLYLSNLVVDRNDTDVRQPLGNVDDKINKIKSIPSMFFNSQYRDTLESMGRIFEPQLNLGIEF
jgi:hypothetical protein